MTKTCTKCGETKPLSSFPLCKGKPRARCRKCHSQDAIAWGKRNPDKVSQNMAAYIARNPRQCLYPPLPAHIKEARKEAGRRKWEQLNPDKAIECKARWARENQHIQMEVCRRRQASKRNATPTWADRAAIQAVYKLARELEHKTGLPHEVDHIVPLTSKVVSGLHVAANLQVLPRKLHRAKSNRFWLDMPDTLEVL